MDHRRKTFRKSAVFGTMLAFVFTGVLGLGIFASPQSAQAQAGMVVSDPAMFALLQAQSLPEATQTTSAVSSAASASVTAGAKVKESTWQVVKTALTNTAVLAVLNAANYFAQKIAYDTANYIASGGKGQKPFFTTEGLGDYLGNVGLDAAGEALGTISQEGGFEKLGINLCSPSSPQVALNIKLGFLNGLPGLLGGPASRSAPQPRCQWRNIESNWSEFSNLDSDTVLSQVGIMFTPGQNSLSAALEFNRYAQELVSKKQQEAINDYIAKSGFKDLVSKVSGKVLTPAEAIKEEMNRANKEAAEGPKRTTEIFSAAAIGEGAFAILPATLQTFAGTLGEKLMKRIYDRGLIALSSLSNPAADDQFNFGSGSSSGGRTAVELANASLLTPRILASTNYNELTVFAACPTEGAQPDNCVMGSDFFNGIQRSQQDEPVTVRQALDQGFLHGERRLLPMSHQDNFSRNCYLTAYCYSNLIKMRKARIIPIGWELAANSPFNDAGDPVTLKEVVDNFNNCPVDATGNVDITALPDPLHPWCRLIDPEWILKYPEAICTQQASGPTLLSSLSDLRGQVCVDSQSCILEDGNGKCIGGYGYCLAEKNFWRLEGDSCPGQYASCQTVRRTSDGKQSSYLMNTTEVDVCNQENSGCRQYGRTGNLVSNGGFEELFGGFARDWNTGVVDASTRRSQNGAVALSLPSGASDTQTIPSVLPGKSYEMSVSALAKDAASDGGIVRMEVRFLDAFDGVVVPDAGELETDCQLAGGGTTAVAEVVLSNLGYLSARCTVTAPDDAVSASVLVRSTGGSAFVDDLALLGASYSFNPLDTMFLNGKTANCGADQVGCREFVKASTATLNLVKNPGFEKETVQGGMPATWSLPSPASYVLDAAYGLEGVSVVVLRPASVTQTIGGVLPDATYVFSVFSRYDGTGIPPSAGATLTIMSSKGVEVAPASVGTGCAISGTDIVVPLPTGDTYQRVECQFTTPSDATNVRIALASSSASEDIVADQVQLELGSVASAFHEGYASGAASVFIKAAPAGLNCTGASTDPATCAKFALSCRREEVGCDLYAPVGGGTSIPAITSAGDHCPAECSGYETFRQEPTDFSDPAFPVFFIPSTAESCSAQEAGCEEFTNLDVLSAGGEAREYFTSLRLCTPPDARTATFYTWEGSDTEGFQLKVWSFRSSNLISSPTGDGGSDPTGGTAPCTNLEYSPLGVPQCADDLATDNIRSCNKLISQFDPDCREFYDVDGNIHYRYFLKTIISSENCTQYRLTRTDESDCRAHGGLWTGSECHYLALGAESPSCRAEANGCRAYTGNASRNVRNVINDTYESGTTDGWEAFPGIGSTSTVVNSNESVSAGGHSLKVTSSQVVKSVSADIDEGGTYLLSFWARGTGDLRVRFSTAGDQDFTFDRLGATDAPIGLSTDWRAYTIGPVQVVRPPASGIDPEDKEQLMFVRSSSGTPIYLDNISLKKVEEAVYAIRDSWNTPVSCDQTPAGDPAPQYMLGCRAYSDSRATPAYLKSFSRLCREEAVGCTALYDTRNSLSPFSETFNAVCTLSVACEPSSGVTCDCEEGGQTVCQVAPGSTTCTFDTPESIDARLTSDGGNISPDGSTVRVQDDALVYLIDTPAHRCVQEVKGCSAFGLPTFNNEGTLVTSWATVNLLDVPEKYGDQLCRAEENFCQAYTRTVDNAQIYFKDPLNHLCEYRTSVTIGGFTLDGWFRNGTDNPCYDSYLEGGTSYGIWKNSDSGFDGWVGTCPANFDQCKEFIDPLDTSQSYPEGQPYFAILNNSLDTSTCQNRVSLTSSPKSASGAAACVLFDQTDVLVKRFDAADSYDASDAKNGALVSAVSSDTNDSNIVIRVSRDRRCGEWLDCRSSETIFNASTGNYQSICTDFAICAQFEQQGDSTQCTEYVDSLHTNDILTTDLYQSRPIGQDGFDLSGFSIPGRYPISEMITVDISSVAGSPNFRLVHSIGESDCDGKVYGAACGAENVLGNTGVCLGPPGKKACVYAIDGNSGFTGDSNLDLSVWERRYPSKSCRAYPQENSPFPSTVADPQGWNETASSINGGNPVLAGLGQAFRGANVCQRRMGADGKEYESCECSYQIGQYGNSQDVRYFSIEDSDIPAGYCSGGGYDSYECDPRAIGIRTSGNLSCCSSVFDGDFGNIGCPDGAQCTSLAKIDRVVGYEGQCLERDLRNPINGSFDEFACSTWRPVGIVGGSLDIYNLNQSAGFFVKPDRKFYCVGEELESIVRFGIWGKDTNDDDYLETYDIVNDGALNPYDLNITKFFGPGTVNNPAANARSKGLDCQEAEDDGPWCVWPGLSNEMYLQMQNVDGKSTPCFKDSQCENITTANPPYGYGYAETEDGICKGFDVDVNADPDKPGTSDDPAEGAGTCRWKEPLYNLKKEALGILGCYEVADGGSASETWIDYPYIGPEVYKEQLKDIFFQVSDDLYDLGPPDDGELHLAKVTLLDGSQIPEEFAAVTNPYQAVWDDCNDEGDDNIDNESPADGQDTDIVSDEHIISKDDTAVQASYFFLEESNGWEVNPSDTSGDIVLKAYFDTYGRLTKIRVAASDKEDEGAFGIREMGFVFKKGCDTVARADSEGEFGLTKGLTDRINSYTNYDGGGPLQGALQSFDTACQPWGAIGRISTEPSGAPWTFVTTHTEAVNQCVGNAFLKAGPLRDPRTTVSVALVESVRNLFRKIEKSWLWMGIMDGSGPSGVPRAQDDLYMEDSSNVYDDTASVLSSLDRPAILSDDGITISSAEYHIPRIATVSAGNCTSDGVCSVGRVGSISINGKESGIITVQNGILKAVTKFYGWASHNAMPILSRQVVWGDFTATEAAGKGWYKNQKPHCASGTQSDDGVGECTGAQGLTCITDTDCPGSATCKTDEPNHFGNTPGACTEGPFGFQHVYTCTSADLDRMPVCTDAASGFASNAPCKRNVDPDGSGLATATPACVYRPGAQIKDNWDWCNCTGSGCEISGGAYGENCDPASATSTRKPWTEFAGELRVFPAPEDVRGPGHGGFLRNLFPVLLLLAP